MIPNIINTLASNKHTSGAALLYAAAKFGCPMAAVWFPAHKPQIDATANLLEGAAVAYGLFAAGDATKSLTKQEADTSFVRKDDTTK